MFQNYHDQGNNCRAAMQCGLNTFSFEGKINANMVLKKHNSS